MRFVLWLTLALAGCAEKVADGAGGDTATAETDTDTETDTDDGGTVSTEDLVASGQLFIFGTPDLPDVYLTATFVEAAAFTSSGEPTEPCAWTPSTPVTTAPTAKPVWLDPGALTVTLDGADVPLTPVGDTFSGEIGGWPVGQTLTFSGTGAEFPPFAVEGILVPPALAVDYQFPNLYLGQDLSLAWTGTTSGLVFLFISATNGSLACSFSDIETAIVPGATVANLDPGDAVVSLGRYVDASTVVDGAYRVTVASYFVVSWATVVQ